jgi:hypothetical protein
MIFLIIIKQQFMYLSFRLNHLVSKIDFIFKIHQINNFFVIKTDCGALHMLWFNNKNWLARFLFISPLPTVLFFFLHMHVFRLHTFICDSIIKHILSETQVWIPHFRKSLNKFILDDWSIDIFMAERYPIQDLSLQNNDMPVHKCMSIEINFSNRIFLFSYSNGEIGFYSTKSSSNTLLS